MPLLLRLRDARQLLGMEECSSALDPKAATHSDQQMYGLVFSRVFLRFIGFTVYRVYRALGSHKPRTTPQSPNPTTGKGAKP